MYNSVWFIYCILVPESSAWKLHWSLLSTSVLLAALNGVFWGKKLSAFQGGHYYGCPKRSRIKYSCACAHTQIHSQTHRDFLLRWGSEVVWGIERHLFPLLVSIEPTTKHYLALMQSHSIQRINNIKTACRLKTTGLLSGSPTYFYKMDLHFHLQTIFCCSVNLYDSICFHTYIQYHAKVSGRSNDF